MRYFFNKTKEYFKEIFKSTKGDLNYEQFEKLEAKKYPKQNQNNNENYRRHDPFSCSDDCFRKR